MSGDNCDLSFSLSNSMLGTIEFNIHIHIPGWAPKKPPAACAGIAPNNPPAAGAKEIEKRTTV